MTGCWIKSDLTKIWTPICVKIQEKVDLHHYHDCLHCSFLVLRVQCYNEGHLILNCVLNWSLFISPTRLPGPLLCPTSGRRSCRWGLPSTGSAAWLPGRLPWPPAEPPAGRGGSSRPRWPTPPGLYPDFHRCHGRSYGPLWGRWRRAQPPQ